MPQPNGFTFYGDLLGIGAAYKLSADVAYEKLNKFYNVVFEHLKRLCVNESLRVNLFSDSLLVWGRDPLAIIGPLQNVYLELFREKIFLRGAMVDGKVEREPRIEVKNLQKFLPINDSLARAVGLEESTKGARFLISPKLGERLLANVPEWRTVEGYIDHANNGLALESVLRRICPLPEGTAYELLYFWHSSQLSENGFDYKNGKATLKEISQYLRPAQVVHYRETVDLIKRSELRDRSTRRAFRTMAASASQGR